MPGSSPDGSRPRPTSSLLARLLARRLFEEQPGVPDSLSPAAAVAPGAAGEMREDVPVPRPRERGARRGRTLHDDRLAATSRADEPVHGGAFVVAHDFDGLRLGGVLCEFPPGFDRGVPGELTPEDVARRLR